MVSKFSRLALYSALVLGGTCAQADPFAGASSQTGMLTWQWFSDGEAPVTTNRGGFRAGQFYGTFDPDAANTGSDFFRFFCIELTEYATGASVQYLRTTGVIDPVNSAQLTRLFDLYYPPLEPNRPAVGNFAAGSNSSFGDFPNETASAAMQLAIWEIWYGDDLSLTKGAGTDGFYWEGPATAVHTQAQDMLAHVKTANDAGSALTESWTLYRFERDVVGGTGNQNYLSATYVEPRITREGDPLPLPGTLALLGAGLAGIGFARRNVSQ